MQQFLHNLYGVAKLFPCSTYLRLWPVAAPLLHSSEPEHARRLLGYYNELIILWAEPDLLVQFERLVTRLAGQYEASPPDRALVRMLATTCEPILFAATTKLSDLTAVHPAIASCVVLLGRMLALHHTGESLLMFRAVAGLVPLADHATNF